MKAASVSVVVPVFNGSRTIPLLVEQLETVLRKSAQTFEVLLVNDGSVDASWEVIEQLAAGRPWVRGIDLPRNSGQQHATLLGMRAARYETIVTLDDDLQHAPEAIPLLLSRLTSDIDLVYAEMIDARRSLIRGLARSVVRPLLVRLVSEPRMRHASAFRVMRAELRDHLATVAEGEVVLDALLCRAARAVASVPVREMERGYGRSNYGLWMLIRHSARIVRAARRR
jgi:undecaprenyl-phosphate 4-deoxy-4-formamido-L-arabinose transferase